MLFPEALYLLSERDQRVTWLDPVIRGAAVAFASTTDRTTTLFTVPIGQVLVLTAAHMLAVATADQTQDLILSLRAPTPAGAASTFPFAASSPFNTIGNRLNFSGQLLVPPGWLVQMRAIYGAGANPESEEGHIFGVLIPAGNVQRL